MLNGGLVAPTFVWVVAGAEPGAGVVRAAGAAVAGVSTWPAS